MFGVRVGRSEFRSSLQLTDAFNATPQRPQNSCVALPTAPQFPQTTARGASTAGDGLISALISMTPVSVICQPESHFSTVAGRRTMTSPADGLSQLKSS